MMDWTVDRRRAPGTQFRVGQIVVLGPGVKTERAKKKKSRFQRTKLKVDEDDDPWYAGGGKKKEEEEEADMKARVYCLICAHTTTGFAGCSLSQLFPATVA